MRLLCAEQPDEIRKLDVDVLIGTDGREAFVRHMIGAAQTRQKWDCVDDAGGRVPLRSCLQADLPRAQERF